MAGLIADIFIQKRKKPETYNIYMNELKKERKLFIIKTVRVYRGFVAQAEYVISCANYYTS